MLNRRGENRHPYLVSDPSKKAFSSTPLNEKLNLEFSYILYQIEEVSIFSSYEFFLTNMC